MNVFLLFLEIGFITYFIHTEADFKEEFIKLFNEYLSKFIFLDVILLIIFLTFIIQINTQNS